jgi:hypothetical protein
MSTDRAQLGDALLVFGTKIGHQSHQVEVDFTGSVSEHGNAIKAALIAIIRCPLFDAPLDERANHAHPVLAFRHVGQENGRFTQTIQFVDLLPDGDIGDLIGESIDH